MKSYKEIPFYSNTPDDLHCFQAALKMILKYFWPNKYYTWGELDKMTAKIEELWTWPTAGLIWLKEKGLGVKVIDNFDDEKFIQLGEQYLIEEYGEEVSNEQIKHSDINQEIKLTKKFVKMIEKERKIPEIDDIKKLMLDDYIVVVNINSRTLNQRSGYAGHFIIIKGFNEKGFIVNDPGLPGRENFKVDFEFFEKTWAYPNEKAKSIMAFKLK
jgi:hypothetical protein